MSENRSLDVADFLDSASLHRGYAGYVSRGYPAITIVQYAKYFNPQSVFVKIVYTSQTFIRAENIDGGKDSIKRIIRF